MSDSGENSSSISDWEFVTQQGNVQVQCNTNTSSCHPTRKCTGNTNTSSISDWEFVTQQGNVQDDDDTDSTASSVEVVDEEEEEQLLGQPISGTSPGSTPIGSPYRAPAVPMFILRLSSREVLDSDDEQDSGQESSAPPPTAPGHVTCEPDNTPDSDLVEPTTRATETISQTSAISSGCPSQTVIQDQVECLVEALDSVQGNLTGDQSREISTSAEAGEANDSPVTHPVCVGEETSTDDMKQTTVENVGNQSRIDPIAENQSTQEINDDRSGQESGAVNVYNDEGRQLAKIPGSTNHVEDVGPQINAEQLAITGPRILPRSRRIVTPVWCWPVILCLTMFAIVMILLNLGLINYHEPNYFDENLERTLRGNIEELSKMNTEKNTVISNREKTLATTKSQLDEANIEVRRLRIELRRLRDLERRVQEQEQTNRGREVPEEQPSREQAEEHLHGNNGHRGQSEGQSEYRTQYHACWTMVQDMYQREIVEKLGTSWSFTEYLQHDLSKDMAKAFSTISKTTADYFGYSQAPEHSSPNEKHKETSEPKKTGKFTPNEGKKSEKNTEHRNEYHSAGSDQSQSTGSDQSQSTGSAGTWSATVMDMMNKTKNQIHNTWEQVRENYEHLWEEHEPALRRMKNKFVNKLQHVSDKFKHKLAKKARKWFNYGNRRAQKTAEAGPKPATGGTKRRTSEASGDISIHQFCTKLEKVQSRIKSLTVRELSEHVDRDMLTNLKDLQELWKPWQQYHKDAAGAVVLSFWFKCQQSWWSSSPRHVLENCGTDCSYLECWQIRAAQGDKAECFRVCGDADMELAMHAICSPHAIQQTQKAHDKIPTNDQHTSTNQKKGHSHSTDTLTSDEKDELGGRLPTSDDYSDGGNDNWFTARGEDREFHHSEPDDWYFRRNKKEFDVSSESHATHEEGDWYQVRAEAREYHHQEPDNWQFRRNEKHSETVIKKDQGVPPEPDWDKLDL